jgi:hypothetical protein
MATFACFTCLDLVSLILRYLEIIGFHVAFTTFIFDFALRFTAVQKLILVG